MIFFKEKRRYPLPCTWYLQIHDWFWFFYKAGKSLLWVEQIYCISNFYLQGQFVEGCMHGKGTYTWSDGLEYDVSRISVWFINFNFITKQSTMHKKQTQSENEFVNYVFFSVDVYMQIKSKMTYTRERLHWNSTHTKLSFIYFFILVFMFVLLKQNWEWK